MFDMYMMHIYDYICTHIWCTYMMQTYDSHIWFTHTWFTHIWFGGPSLIYLSHIWSYTWHIYVLPIMGHICVMYMIIYVCKHMMHIYDHHISTYVISRCDEIMCKDVTRLSQQMSTCTTQMHSPDLAVCKLSCHAMPSQDLLHWLLFSYFFLL